MSDGPFEVYNAHNEGRKIGKSTVDPEILDMRQPEDGPYTLIVVKGKDKWDMARRVCALLNAEASMSDARPAEGQG